MSEIKVVPPRCRAGEDGDCIWADCPQEKDGRKNYQPHCPYDLYWSKIDDENEI